MDRISDFQKAQLALTSWRYGKDYAAPGMLMIAQVFMNRHKKGWNTLLGVLDSAPKFSASKNPPLTGYPEIWDRAFLKLLSEIDLIFDGTAKDATNQALFFGDTNKVDSEWFLEEICRSGRHNRVADLNTLTFWN